MNQWVYDGFAITYKKLESILIASTMKAIPIYWEKCSSGRFRKGFSKRPDGSVWIDLTDGLDRKIVLRSDGTAVYMTQDIGTAIQREKIIQIGGMVVHCW
jgi:arginyl-tRNA synthetase